MPIDCEGLQQFGCVTSFVAVCKFTKNVTRAEILLTIFRTTLDSVGSEGQAQQSAEA